MNYTELTDAQRAQVIRRFADPSFGTDPTRFDYELADQGEVTGRRLLEPGVQSRKWIQKQIMTCEAQPEVDVSVAMVSQTQAAGESLARRMIGRFKEVEIDQEVEA